MEFSDIALAKLLQTAPDLGPLVLNFQDVTGELGEDAGCQVGIFILRSGAETMFVPVISRGDDVYPIDSIFVDSEKKFLPLTRKIIDSVIATGQTEPGKSTKMPDTVPVNPSVYSLINPPRTGKFVYASASRLVDFLAELPAHVKQATYEKIAAERSVYDSLDKMFGLKAIFDVLRPAPKSLAAVTNQAPISIVTSPSAGMSDEAISNILNDGYHVVGSQPTRRVAVSVQSFNDTGKIREISAVDSDRDYSIAFRNGTMRDAFIPKMHVHQKGGRVLALYTNGDYSVSSSLISVGDDLNRKQVLDMLFNTRPPVLLRDVTMGDTFVLMTVDGEFLGPYRAGNVVMNSYGVEISTSGIYSGSVSKICGYRNFMGKADLVEKSLYVPSNTVVLILGEDVTSEAEVSVNGTARRLELSSLQLLGSELNLGFDGIEFSANGRPVGGVPQVMEMLVVREGVDPDLAKNFVKQAQETKFVKIFMSKQASTDYNPAEVPQYGEVPNKTGDVSMNGAFMPAVQQSAALGDSQVVEATIISELLQVPDMFEQISEYLPDIEEAVDKLGRIMFMSRIHINRLAESIDSDSVFSLLAQLKSVYRLLGDNMMRLRSLTNSARIAGDPEDR
ncbi:MAG TPA: hypothetical protein VFM18_05280 [Methanosarcina sp.]|nr:hypothetical protein [Methanosarcina sp.]